MASSDLRNAIIAAVEASMGEPIRDDERKAIEGEADAILATLARSEHREALLTHVGNVHPIKIPEWFNAGHTTDFTAIHVGREHQRYGIDAFVVVPREEEAP